MWLDSTAHDWEANGRGFVLQPSDTGLHKIGPYKAVKSALQNQSQLWKVIYLSTATTNGPVDFLQ